MIAALIYPHQLFENHPAVKNADLCVLVEDPLFFSQFGFHSQKLVLHRASMKCYAQDLVRKGRSVHYVEFGQLKHSGQLAELIKGLGVVQVRLVDPCDDWLSSRLIHSLNQNGIAYDCLPDPNFLTPKSVFEEYGEGRKRWYFTEFYISQRKRLGLLLDTGGGPIGGKWSYDPDNRKKLPKGTPVPFIRWPKRSSAVGHAMKYVGSHCPHAPGESTSFFYPISSKAARTCLQDFLENRLASFGDYEDAIEPNEAFLYHSVLTPALNIGLLSPSEVVSAALEYRDRIPINSLEGFVRQIIGWREYMRGVYLHFGRQQRTTNYWDHHREMPAAFYDGTTGIEPVDTVIHRVLKYAYCHHIERLMVLGNFMLLCEISPDDIYRWFIELFIDSYDWVMVPNVYGMSQHADGGLITTKPYISGSAYILKMSHFGRGPWCEIWDALYWRFIDKHREFFSSNPRMSVMVSQCNRLGNRLLDHQRIADKFLSSLN